jgi:hypothetical protein
MKKKGTAGLLPGYDPWLDAPWEDVAARAAGLDAKAGRRLFAQIKKDRDAQESIWDARDGNTKTIVKRLRTGRISTKERTVLADLIEGKIKTHRLKPRQLTRRDKNSIANLVFIIEARYHNDPKWPRKRIIGVVGENFGVKPRVVYNILKALGPKRREEKQRAFTAFAAMLARK